MNEKQLIHVLGHLAEELVPGDVDLWPAIRVHFETSNQHSHTGDLSMNANLAPSRRLRLASRRLRLASRRLRLAAIVVLTLLVISGLVFATPQGRVWAQSLLRFFTRSESNSIPAPTDIPLVWVQQTPGVPAATTTPLPGLAFETNCGPLNNPKCSIEQIRSKVSFAIKELGSIPEGMYYLGATGDPNHVYIQYLTPDHSTGLLLMQEPWTGSADQTDWKIGPNAVVETVQIGSLTGEYVKGSYGYRSGDVQEIWNENIGIQNLRWVDLGVFSVLQRYGPDGQFDRDRMVALAESLTTRPVATSLTPMPTATPTPTSIPSTPEPAVQFTLSLAEASEKAGFTVQAPTYLPEKFIYKGTSYDPGTHLVGLSFDYDDSMVTVGAYGKWIREELVLPAGRCNLCPFRGGDDGKAAWADPTASIIPQDSIETVQIGAVAGQYVEGMYHNGGEWEPDPYAKRLRWQANGIAFEIFMTGNDFAKENVIAIAESMK